MNQITNVSQFKKALTVGRKINVTHYRWTGTAENPGEQIQPTRPVSIVQSNSFAIKTEISAGEFVDAWQTYPRASEAKFVDNKMQLYAKHPTRGQVLLSVYSFPE